MPATITATTSLWRRHQRLLRWVLLPMALLTVWYACLALGLWTYFAIEQQACPAADLVSGFCQNTLVHGLLQAVQYLFVGLSAALCVCTGVWIAPTQRSRVNVLVWIVGSVCAVLMGYQTQAWDLSAVAIVNGLAMSMAVQHRLSSTDA